jgi:hypothetical protein
MQTRLRQSNRRLFLLFIVYLIMLSSQASSGFLLVVARKFIVHLNLLLFRKVLRSLQSCTVNYMALYAIYEFEILLSTFRTFSSDNLPFNCVVNSLHKWFVPLPPSIRAQRDNKRQQWRLWFVCKMLCSNSHHHRHILTITRGKHLAILRHEFNFNFNFNLIYLFKTIVQLILK